MTKHQEYTVDTQQESTVDDTVPECIKAVPELLLCAFADGLLLWGLQKLSSLS